MDSHLDSVSIWKYDDLLINYWAGFVGQRLAFAVSNTFIAMKYIPIPNVYGFIRFLILFIAGMRLDPFIVEGFVLRFFLDSDFVQAIVCDGARSLFNCFFHLWLKKVLVVRCRNEYAFLEQILFILQKNLIYHPKFLNSYHSFINCSHDFIPFRSYNNYLLDFEVLINLH